jgi:hypothetical protein
VNNNIKTLPLVPAYLIVIILIETIYQSFLSANMCVRVALIDIIVPVILYVYYLCISILMISGLREQNKLPLL